jgi:hypothetical protein
MKLEDASIDLDLIKNIKAELTLDYLKVIHEKYCASVEQILTMLSSPLVLMGMAMIKVKQDHLPIKSAVKLGFLTHNPPSDPKETAELLVKFFEEELKKSSENVVEEAQKESQALYEKSEEIRAVFNDIGLNALVNSWTLFEAFIKDIWITTLNTYPELLNAKIINAKSDNENNNNGKMISLSLLSKYNYNISDYLGEVLVSKYDFTGVEGIKKSFKDLLTLNEEEITFLNSTTINQLEICRHIIVHNAAVIDNKYIVRSKRENEENGQKLLLDITEISEMINYSIECVKSILLLVERKINNR